MSTQTKPQRLAQIAWFEVQSDWHWPNCQLYAASASFHIKERNLLSNIWGPYFSDRGRCFWGFVVFKTFSMGGSLISQSYILYNEREKNYRDEDFKECVGRNSKCASVWQCCVYQPLTVYLKGLCLKFQPDDPTPVEEYEWSKCTAGAVCKSHNVS